MEKITMENIKNGTCQFNSKSAKEFRTSIAKWHNATFEIADELLAKSDRVKALHILVDSNSNLISKLEKGESIIGEKSVTDLQSEIDTWNASIDYENNAMAEFRKAQSDRLVLGEKLVSKDLYSDFTVLSVAQFLSDNGVEPCMDTITTLMSAIGKKTNSARNMCKSGKHNGSMSFVAFRKVFLGELCDIMGDALPLYKFKYVLKDKRAKKDA